MDTPSTDRLCCDKFGVLLVNSDFSIGPYNVRAVDNFEEIENRISCEKHLDGYIYPPVGSDWSVDVKGTPVAEIPNTRKPLHLFKSYITHEIMLDSHEPITQDFRGSEGALIIHLLALVFNTRCQFDGWWHEGRLPIEPRPIAVWTREDLERLLNHVFSVWRRWPTNVQRHYISLLHLQTRNVTYEWHWEMFVFYYMIVDGIWNILEHLKGKNWWTSKYGKKKPSHRKRLAILREEVLQSHRQNEDEKKELDRIYELRNDWFHEGLWDKEASPFARMVGTGGSGKSIIATLSLGRFARRLLVGVTEAPCGYVSSRWWGVAAPVALEWKRPP